MLLRKLRINLGDRLSTTLEANLDSLEANFESLGGQYVLAVQARANESKMHEKTRRWLQEINQTVNSDLKSVKVELENAKSKALSVRESHIAKRRRGELDSDDQVDQARTNNFFAKYERMKRNQRNKRKQASDSKQGTI